MNALLSAIRTKLAAATLYTYVGGRVFLDNAYQGTIFPYVVYFIVASNPDDTFNEKIEDTLIQFSLFSTSDSAAEISTMYGYLQTALDDTALTIAGYTHLWLVRRNLVTLVDDLSIAQDGSEMYKHWAVEYSVLTQA